MRSSTRRPLRAGAAFLLLAISLAPNAGCRNAGRPSPEAADTAPVRILLGWSGDPATSQAVTWRTADAVASPRAQIGLAAPGCSGAAGPVRAVTAEPRPVRIDAGRSVMHYKAAFSGLAPATTYAYRVGGASFSRWHCFTTATAGPAPFRFIYLGDAQNGLGTKWPRVVRAAFAAAPDARFVAHAGDLLDEGRDDAQWGAWVAGLGEKAAEVPGIPAPGNHDVVRSVLRRVYAAPDLWNAHFALPANGPPDLPGLAGQNYVVDYQGVRVVALDVNAFANEDFEESQRPRVQAAQLLWLRAVLGTNPQRWTVVVQHYPLYSIAKSRDYAGLRAALGPIYDEYGVDLVLQGHDHAYGRTHKVSGGRVADPQAPGTIYVISVSGSKSYPVATRWTSLMARVREGEALYQVVSVDGDRLAYESRAANGTVVDGVDLLKAHGPVSRYAERARGE